MKKTTLLSILFLLILSGCSNRQHYGNIATAPVTSGDIATQNTYPEITIPSLSRDPEDLVNPDPSTHEAAISAPPGDTVSITEKLFVAQVNDIYYNADDYLGKTIQYEGIFHHYEDPVTGLIYFSVLRYGPGCCGIDDVVGFEVIWDHAYPETNDWVFVQGILEEYEEGDRKYLRIALTEISVLPTRGMEFVS